MGAIEDVVRELFRVLHVDPLLRTVAHLLVETLVSHLKDKSTANWSMRRPMPCPWWRGLVANVRTYQCGLSLRHSSATDATRLQYCTAPTANDHAHTDTHNQPRDQLKSAKTRGKGPTRALPGGVRCMSYIY